jgi:hypothetical protein
MQSHMSDSTFGVDTHGQLRKKPHPKLEFTYRIGIELGTSLIPICAISYWYTDSTGAIFTVFKISHQGELVTHPRRNATMVCGASCHILGFCICVWDSKIWFCRRPSGLMPEIQHNQRGRGVPTLT